jgi:hypothetical protein
MNIKGLIAYIINKKNIPYNILYLVGFIIAAYGYGIKAALILLLFTISIIIVGFYISEIFLFLKFKKDKFDRYKITSTVLFLIFITLDVIFLKLFLIMYIILLGIVIAVISVYRNLKYPRS